MEIIIHQAILHVLDTTMDAPVLSGGPMELCQTDRKNESCPQMGKKTADRRMYSLNKTDKKASRKIKHRKISRVHKECTIELHSIFTFVKFNNITLPTHTHAS